MSINKSSVVAICADFNINTKTEWIDAEEYDTDMFYIRIQADNGMDFVMDYDSEIKTYLPGRVIIIAPSRYDPGDIEYDFSDDVIGFDYFMDCLAYMVENDMLRPIQK